MARMLRMADPSHEKTGQAPAGQAPAGPASPAAVIRFACGTCKERLVVPDRHAGRKGKCPNCGTINRVPAVSEFDEPVPVPPGSHTPAPAPAQPAAPRQPESERERLTSLTQAPPAPAPQASPAVRAAPPVTLAEAPAPTARPSPPGWLDRLTSRLSRRPRSGGTDALDVPADLLDAGGIPPAVKLLFVLGALVLVPLLIGAVVIIMILLRVKLAG